MLDAIAIQCGPHSSGSAVAISETEAITAYHVVRNGGCTVGAGSALTIKSSDRPLDFAVVVARQPRFRGRAVGYSCNRLTAGETYTLSGRLGSHRATATGNHVRTIDPVYRYTFEAVAELEGPSESGMSGGAVVDQAGRVVAVISSSSATRTYVRELADTPLCGNP